MRRFGAGRSGARSGRVPLDGRWVTSYKRVCRLKNHLVTSARLMTGVKRVRFNAGLIGSCVTI